MYNEDLQVQKLKEIKGEDKIKRKPPKKSLRKKRLEKKQLREKQPKENNSLVAIYNKKPRFLTERGFLLGLKNQYFNEQLVFSFGHS